jgi:4'-phosphopantetheinyl transferase
VTTTDEHGAALEVSLYVAAGEGDLAALAATDGLLDADERECAARFVSAADRELYRAAHVLLRRALSRHAPVDPAAWRFARGTWGRPEIAAPAPCAGERLHFNLAHTRGLVCCAVTDEAAVGIDAECERPLNDALDIARRFFSPAEADALAALPAQERMQSFYALWTLKECFVKALGRGLSIELDRFAFRLAAGTPGSIALTREHSLGDCDGEGDGDWRFVQLRIDGGCTLAAGVRAARGARFHVHPISPVGRLPRLALCACSAGVRLAGAAGLCGGR